MATWTVAGLLAGPAVLRADSGRPPSDQSPPEKQHAPKNDPPPKQPKPDPPKHDPRKHDPPKHDPPPKPDPPPVGPPPGNPPPVPPAPPPGGPTAPVNPPPGPPPGSPTVPTQPSPPPNPPPPSSPPGKNAAVAGHYKVSVRGFWTGEGDAAITATSVDITASVKSDTGQSGTLSAKGLRLHDGKFAGGGTLGDIQLAIAGRVDAADDSGPGNKKAKRSGHQPVLIDARIGATYTGGGHSGRIAGGRD